LLHENPPPALTTTGPAVDAPSGEPASPSPGASAEIAVNEACLRVVNETRDVLDAIQELGDSAAELDIAGVDQAIRMLQPLESRLRADLAACEVDSTLPGDLAAPLPSGSSPPTAPSASPTD
jgi:hypothetical protein